MARSDAVTVGSKVRVDLTGKKLFFGDITVKSCMMIDAVINGPTPSITIERLANPPPENMFRRPRN